MQIVDIAGAGGEIRTLKNSNSKPFGVGKKGGVAANKGNIINKII
ncbi:uncharacterized protein METZ01_LOCUS7091 [marine metagenome]|uniref:Uncharacterized protein n=1 Tax=marine metagenome TaxID=408172 RepID=A0A381NI91_9ZZZZ